MGMSRSRGVSKIRLVSIPERSRYPFGVGATGDGFHAIAVLDALERGTPFPDPEEFGLEDPSVTVALACQKGKSWLINGRGCWMRVDERVMAVGGGFEFAIGAMEAGATSRRAVQIAEKRSTASSHGVDVLEV
jgi:hypothetical protein